ncbi:hypothetical protein BJV78DRAFT_612292 [Lactifluus subvellereus]|nr:hypothetical protein BJV78DRAFT_612292 [Lactifluus subvellereus]
MSQRPLSPVSPHETSHKRRPPHSSSMAHHSCPGAKSGCPCWTMTAVIDAWEACHADAEACMCMFHLSLAPCMCSHVPFVSTEERSHCPVVWAWVAYLLPTPLPCLFFFFSFLRSAPSRMLYRVAAVLLCVLCAAHEPSRSWRPTGDTSTCGQPLHYELWP